MAELKPFYCHGCGANRDRETIMPTISTFHPGMHFCGAECIGLYEGKIQEKLKTASVQSPKHYNQGPIECIDAIKSALTPEEFRGFCKGSALKYVWRERHKGGAVDLEKAGDYLRRLGEEKTNGN